MRFFLVALGVVVSPGAFAHGGEKHAAPKFDYSKAVPTDFGIAANPAQASRTIRVEMRDTMRFSPAALTVKQGDVVRLVAANKGQLLHELVLGTREELEQHAALMKKFPGMEHDEPHMVHVGPGKSGEIGWKFTRAGTFHFACLLPGHYEAGMIGKVEVVK